MVSVALKSKQVNIFHMLETFLLYLSVGEYLISKSKGKVSLVESSQLETYCEQSEDKQLLLNNC